MYMNELPDVVPASLKHGSCEMLQNIGCGFEADILVVSQPIEVSINEALRGRSEHGIAKPSMWSGP